MRQEGGGGDQHPKKDLADQQVSEVAQDYQKHNRKAAQTEASE